MKYIRNFGSTNQRDAVLASIDYKILQKTTGVVGVSLIQGTYVPEPVIDITTPFYIEDVSGSDNTVQITKSNYSAPTLTIEKSTDGTTWETMGTSATVPANGKLYLRCSATQWASGGGYYNYFSSASGDINVGGNINSLLYGSSFNGQTEFPSGVGTYTLFSLFKNNTRIISAQQLLLPATTLKSQCYGNMFTGCTSLTSAPVLPATTLNVYCYSSMFYNCSALTTAPALPATTLANNCYQSMFTGCTSLTTAPELPATTLTGSCYNTMFQGCTNLNYIKCLATNISVSNCTTKWVNNVASTGTFVKDPNMSSWTTGVGGIPTGWTVQDA